MKVPGIRVPVLRACSIALLAACGAGAAQTPGPGPATATPRVEWVPPPSATPALATSPAPIPAAEYAGRRAALAAEMADGVLVAFGAPPPEQDYLPYVQDPNFFYLTGIIEPDARLIMVKSGRDVRELLFVQPRDPAREVWEGARLGPDGARALTGIPTSTVDAFRPTLDSLLTEHRTLHALVPVPSTLGAGGPLGREQQILAGALERHPGTQVQDLAVAMLRLRAAKSGAELDRIRRAAHITVLAHRAAIRSVEPGMNEFEIEALIEYTFRRNGAERPAFASIVGSGPNSTSLHYNANDRFMREGDVVVMDVGASYRGYAADITRTVPVSGEFSPEQRAIYEVVLAAQKAAESAVQPGSSWRDVSAAAERVLAEGLARLGLIDAPDATYDCGTGDREARCPQLRLFYMHGLGHGIGLDVHDPDIYVTGGPGDFRVGSAFTIEPGIYVRADALDHLPPTDANRAMIERLRPAVERYRNIGVRIEDDYFLTSDGVERISAGAPREIAEIEALMREENATATSRRPEVVEWYRAFQPERLP